MPRTGLITSYSKFADNDLDAFSQKVVVLLTGNPNFPTTTPPVAVVSQKQVAFNNAITQAASGDRVAVALKNQARKELLHALQQSANDVTTQANGDLAKLISSGFHLVGDGETAPPMDAPKEFKITDGPNKGELKLSCRRVSEAVSYIFEYTDTEPKVDTKWTHKASTARECTITGLASGTRIYARVTAIGHRDQKITSDIISRIVQ